MQHTSVHLNRSRVQNQWLQIVQLKVTQFEKSLDYVLCQDWDNICEIIHPFYFIDLLC